MIETAHTMIDKLELPSVGDELGAGDAHVWRASLDRPADVIAKLAPFLSQDERHRADRFHRHTDRRRFAAGRGILRKIISRYLALAPGEGRFVYNKYGKPFISDNQNRGSLGFNLSHSNDMVLYVFARRRHVGIDIEYMREDFATLEVAERFFSVKDVTTFSERCDDLHRLNKVELRAQLLATASSFAPTLTK